MKKETGVCQLTPENCIGYHEAYNTMTEPVVRMLRGRRKEWKQKEYLKKDKIIYKHVRRVLDMTVV